MVAVRRDLHQHPELSWEEDRTARVIARALEDLGIDCRTGVAKTGIVADLPGTSSAGTIALRADMDALPVTERTGLPFASVRHGVMHACGHDAHSAMLVGAAALLMAERYRSLPVRLVFQPAEELGTGAPAMIDQGAIEGVTMIFGGHVDLGYSVGEIVVHDGAVNASTDEFTITLHGPGGHAARPHESTDPILAASDLISAIQTIVSRRVPPTQPAVVTVGRIEGGTAPNILASRVRLDGTVRAQSPEIRELLRTSLQDLATAIGARHRIQTTTEFLVGTPPVVNAEPCIALCRAAAMRTVGVEAVRALAAPNMGGEDFGFYLERIPGCYVRFGARGNGPQRGPAHSGEFDFDEAVLSVGARYFYEVAVEAGP
jgi:hippurate hydrolase